MYVQIITIKQKGTERKSNPNRSSLETEISSSPQTITDFAATIYNTGAATIHHIKT